LEGAVIGSASAQVFGIRISYDRIKKTIRKQIEKALSTKGADPIQRLELQIASAKRKGDRTEVLEGLKRFLESGRARKHRTRGVKAKT
jgi:hypothetical protein